jgi:hypothetical protein
MSEPEVDAVQTALAGLPAEWLTPDFEATILRRAGLQAAARKMVGQVAAAEAGVAASLARIDSGDASDATLAALVDGRATLAEVRDAQALLPAPTVDTGACAQPLENAGRALTQLAPLPPNVPAYVAEMDSWRAFTRRSGQHVDPPVPMDADRAVEPGFRDALARVEAWRAGVAGWRGLNVATADPVNMLAAAASYAAQVAEVVPVVASADQATGRADASRKTARLNWSPPS